MTLEEEDEDYTTKSADASRMGKAASISRCSVLHPGHRGSPTGRQRWSTTKESTSSFTVATPRRCSRCRSRPGCPTAKRVRSEGFVAFVRAQTFTPRPALDLLFVAVDVARGAVMKAWLVPSEIYAATLTAPNSRGRYRFVASMKPESNDRWRPVPPGGGGIAPGHPQALGRTGHASAPPRRSTACRRSTSASHMAVVPVAPIIELIGLRPCCRTPMEIATTSRAVRTRQMTVFITRDPTS